MNEQEIILNYYQSSIEKQVKTENDNKVLQHCVMVDNF